MYLKFNNFVSIEKKKAENCYWWESFIMSASFFMEPFCVFSM